MYTRKNTLLGKYKARVVNIDDPQKRGRIRVSCPKVIGNAISAWCNPCVPVATDFSGDFCLPKINDTVWIEFENQDIDKPIYIGGWYSTNSTPCKDYTKSSQQRIISFNGSKIEMSENDIKITTNDTPTTTSKIELNINKESTIIKVGNTNCSINEQDITLTVGTTSCTFNENSLRELKKLIGG